MGFAWAKYDDGESFLWTEYGNINYGLAARVMGFSLDDAKFGAGMQQVFGDGDGPIEWSNFDGYFDQSRDTRNIEFGYNMRLPWEN